MNFTEAIAKITGVEGQLTALTERQATLETSLIEQKAKADGLDTQLTSLKIELDTERTEKATLAAQAKEATEKAAALETSNSELQAKLSDPKGAIQTEAARQAQNVLAQTGTPPVETDTESQASADGQSVEDQYMALTDPGARFAFFQKNFSSLSRATALALN